MDENKRDKRHFTVLQLSKDDYVYVPIPSTPQFGKLLAFEIKHLQNYKNLLVTMLLSQIIIYIVIKN